LKDELRTPADVAVVCHTLIQAVLGGKDWKSWPTCEGRHGEKWL